MIGLHFRCNCHGLLGECSFTQAHVCPPSTNISSSPICSNPTRLAMPLDSPLLSFLPTRNFHKWTLLRNQDRYGHLCYFYDQYLPLAWCPQITLSHFLTFTWTSERVAFCSNALGWNSICASFSLPFPLCRSLLLDSLFAVLPVCGRAPCFTPTGTNTVCVCVCVCVWNISPECYNQLVILSDYHCHQVQVFWV